jgi:hypothetical protein
MRIAGHPHFLAAKDVQSRVVPNKSPGCDRPAPFGRADRWALHVVHLASLRFDVASAYAVVTIHGSSRAASRGGGGAAACMKQGTSLSVLHKVPGRGTRPSDSGVCASRWTGSSRRTRCRRTRYLQPGFFRPDPRGVPSHRLRPPESAEGHARDVAFPESTCNRSV